MVCNWYGCEMSHTTHKETGKWQIDYLWICNQSFENLLGKQIDYELLMQNFCGLKMSLI
jgi:hypothetical protein